MQAGSCQVEGAGHGEVPEEDRDPAVEGGVMATEKRLISLDEALEATHKEVLWTESEAAAIRSFLVKLPKADAVEVVHGHWEYGTRAAVCSECGFEIRIKSSRF